MSNFLKVAAFSLFIIGVYTFFADRLIPPIAPQAPPPLTEVAARPMTADGLARLGEEVFKGKGACTLCHNPVGGRAPLLDGIIIKANERIKGPGYRGGAKDAAEYIRESMVNPSAYVVPGFGVAGTHDTKSPMPDVRGSEIGLSEVEIDAVIAYFQRSAGVEVTVGSPAAGPEGK
ncbi:MAG: hypothetical protein HY893_03900 [Deltaproteobacteria bacterium]|nr:hypothetical protein [Deltaproteobacteria bacterium]